MKNARLTRLVPAALALLALAGCSPAGPSGWQGYLEGEFVHLAAPLGGRLERLAVARGGQRSAGVASGGQAARVRHQAGAVRGLLEAAGFVDVACHRDLAGIDRVVAARRT
jgi:hypothetical protein